MRVLFAFALTFLLTGCVTFGELTETAAKMPATPFEGTIDQMQASWGNLSRETLSLRTGRMPGPLTTARLQQACEKGQRVEVIAAPTVANRLLTGTPCISIWSSIDPDVLDSPQVLLVDTDSLVVEGQMRAGRGSLMLREYKGRAALKFSGNATRLR